MILSLFYLFYFFLNFFFITATSTDARIKQEVHEEPSIKMQKTDHVAQRRISQHKNSPVAPQLAPPSENLPFPGQNSANVWQNPYLQAMASKLLLGNGQSPFTQFQAAQTNMFAANPLLGNPAAQALLAQYQRMIAAPLPGPLPMMGFPQYSKFFPSGVLDGAAYLKSLANKSALSPNSVYSGGNTATEPSNSPTESTTTPPLLNYGPPQKVEPASPDLLPGSKQGEFQESKVPRC